MTFNEQRMRIGDDIQEQRMRISDDIQRAKDEDR